MTDIREVFERIPQITRLPNLVRKGNRYLGRCYIDGTPHHREGKLDIAIKYTDNGYRILILENGGDCLTLEQWLINYGGASSFKEAMDIMFNRGWSRNTIELTYRDIKPIPTKYISQKEFEKEVSEGKQGYCNLVRFLILKFGKDAVIGILNKYMVTTDQYWNTVFWYIDSKGRICKDKHVRYLSNGKRKKDTKYPFWSKFKAKDGYNSRVVYGDHLIEEGKDICVVESEKTALLCALSYPDKIWVALGGKNNTSLIQKGWLLYPDYDAREDWLKLGNVVEWWENEDVEGNMDIGDLIVNKI